ncbi:MAG: isoaspartyl peptidase/L-asparaginase [Flavobacteriia bacterium]|nr:isoaspartyl peptidase/L-asparaginase [Flavobacteriia bacterium]PIV97403.1 MAG: beta-aspartyl-peptidase [Flavobacteriaceae bacterium CG17_big_fil_post_rev_8_21_14_2_50_31_13]PIX13263.1 MAG: beta-aspartyl-peptidase [Flavobacteriaceae bacterium CG_4_8_14_3_um_filter_31_8]PIY14762.1 MAG: beta-aspartyl-peptidase [Flavobacteriaceae bacterium CG_4_10_14_3_um_filter_31_253]PIZ12110.1 MAG: beta-aspartyl-peptidase [Flavobacteriaceae bacterium CG_4_10_14_0_8_um_filter_31_99]PJC08847.1 MAG: beta-aspart
MKNSIILAFCSLFLMSCESTSKEEKINDFAIIIHGGAGTILKKNMTDEKEAAYKAKLEEAIKVGYIILKTGGTSTEAVLKTIQVMEESPLFNAGKGAVFTNAGTNELDASFMDGKTLNAGAVAGVKDVKSPIELAIKIMTDSEHVMLSGEGASAFAKEKGLEMVDPSYFYTENRFQSLQKILNQEKTELDHDAKKASFYDPNINDSKFGTVGCVALDKFGNIAAGTSTGGMTNKRWGRIGDAPIIGSGTYANNNTCGVSSTGWGEYFIRSQVAYDISAQMEYQKKSLKEATKDVIQNKLTKLGGTGGVVALDKNGKMSFEFNTAGMYRASMDQKGELIVKIYKE